MKTLLGAVLVATLFVVSSVRAQDTTAQAEAVLDANEGTLDDFLARAECRTSRPDSAPEVIHAAALGSSAVEPRFFCFGIDSTVYGVGLQGEGVAVGPNNARRPFTIRVEPEWFIEGLMYQRYRNTLYLFYEVGNGGCGYGQLEALIVPSLKPRWARAVHTTFNLSPVLLADTVAYLSSLDFVEKVNLRRGTVLWRHLFDAHRGQHYESFYAPHRRNSLVYFPEKSHDLFEKHQPDTVVVDDMTGRIVSPAGLKTAPVHWEPTFTPPSDCS